MIKGLFVLILTLIILSSGGCKKKDDNLNNTPGFRTLAWEEGIKYHYDIIYKDKKIGEMSMQILSNFPGASNDMVFESIMVIHGIKKVTEVRRVFFDPMVASPPKNSSSNIQVGTDRMQSDVSYSDDKARVVFRSDATRSKTDENVSYKKGSLVVDNSSLPFIVRYWSGKKSDIFIILPEMTKGLKGLITRGASTRVKLKKGEFDATDIEVRAEDRSRHFFVEDKKPYRLLRFTIASPDESEIRFELVD